MLLELRKFRNETEQFLLLIIYFSGLRMPAGLREHRRCGAILGITEEKHLRIIIKELNQKQYET